MNDSARKAVVVMGTMDTKGAELTYLARRIEEAGCRAILFDVGAHYKSQFPADISMDQVAAASGMSAEELRRLPRGEAVDKISQAAASYLNDMVASGRANAVIGLGGSGGTTICAAAMRPLPYGVPKLLVSTLASGNTRWHLDISDIVMMPSVLDIGGLNPMLEMVLTNAANAIAGMAKGQQAYVPSGKQVVSLTMYGTTTPGVSQARRR
ncbi:MAG: Tm-1-like ATP-binding domain-containing protein, partial [Rudaea sp.]